MKKTLSFISDRLSTKGDGSSPSSDSKASYLKRREQVRRAQRTHRERKDKYLKSLESEVMQLRANEATFVAEMEGLNAYITQLQDILKANGIPPPAYQGPFSKIGDITNISGRFELSIIHENPSQRLVSGDHNMDILPSQNHNLGNEELPRQSGSTSLTTSANGIGFEEPQNLLDSDIALHPSRKNKELFADGSEVAIGMEFVLTLEKPCLSHIDTDLTKSDQHSGHVLTSTMSLIHLDRYPKSFSSVENPTLRDSMLIFDRLEKLSSELVAEDEYSPIQAWNYITKQPFISQVDSHQVQSLAEKMLQHVACHGFGAVVKREVCEQLVSEVLLGRK